MTEQQNTPPPEKIPMPVHNPLVQAGVSLHACLDPFGEHLDLESFAEDLAQTLAIENIESLSNTRAILALQARVLDALFNRLLLGGLARKGINGECLRHALHAQRQCAQTIEKLKKLTITEKSTTEHKDV